MQISSQRKMIIGGTGPQSRETPSMLEVTALLSKMCFKLHCRVLGKIFVNYYLFPPYIYFYFYSFLILYYSKEIHLCSI